MSGASGAKETIVRMSMLLLSGLVLSTNVVAGRNAENVERFVEAFNQQDIDAMLNLAAEDVRWMSVAGDQLSIETSTRLQLREAMAGYFAGAPGVRAEIRSITESGSFVHTVEKAFWNSNGTEKSQCSMAVYEFVEVKVRNVWYFPAYECP